MRSIKLIAWLTGFLVVFLGAAAFALSFDNLQRLALTQGVTSTLTALWPLGLDAMVIVSSLTVLRASLQNERAAFAWGLLVTFTAASVLFNIVSFDSWLSRSVHALPAIVNVLAVELLTGQLRGSIKRSGAVSSLAEIGLALERQRAELQALEQAADLTERSGQSSARRRPHANPNTDRAVTLAFLLANPGASFSAAGLALSHSKSTIKAHTDKLIADGQLARDGRGWEKVMTA